MNFKKYKFTQAKHLRTIKRLAQKSGNVIDAEMVARQNNNSHELTWMEADSGMEIKIRPGFKSNIFGQGEIRFSLFEAGERVYSRLTHDELVELLKAKKYI